MYNIHPLKTDFKGSHAERQNKVQISIYFYVKGLKSERDKNNAARLLRENTCLSRHQKRMKQK